MKSTKSIDEFIQNRNQQIELPKLDEVRLIDNKNNTLLDNNEKNNNLKNNEDNLNDENFKKWSELAKKTYKHFKKCQNDKN